MSAPNSTDYEQLVDTIKEFIRELESMKQSAHLRANDLTRDDRLRGLSEGTEDAYAFVQIKLRTLI